MHAQFLYGLWFNVPFNSYCHVETVSRPNYTFFLSKCRPKRLTSTQWRLISLVTDNTPSWISRRRRMTKEIISRPISTKHGASQARIKLETPRTAIRLPTDCATGPGTIICYLPTPSADNIFLAWRSACMARHKDSNLLILLNNTDFSLSYRVFCKQNQWY